MKAWKIALAVWLPIIVIGGTYGVIYRIKDTQAYDTQATYIKNLQACEFKAADEGQSTTTNHTGGPITCQITNYGIFRDTFGFPVFKANG